MSGGVISASLSVSGNGRGTHFSLGFSEKLHISASAVDPGSEGGRGHVGLNDRFAQERYGSATPASPFQRTYLPGIYVMRRKEQRLFLGGT